MAQQPSETEALQPHGEAEPSRTQAVLANVTTEIGRVIVGQDQLIERLLVALLTGQHALIEGAPGLAKTLTVSTLASTLELSFSRIQFTPDLLPAGHHRHARLPAVGRAVPAAARPALRERHPRRRDQPRARPRCSPRCWRRCRSARSRSAAPATPCPYRSSCSPRRTRSSTRAPTRCPRRNSTAFMLKILVGYPDRESERSIIRRSLDEEDVEVQPTAGARDLEALVLETRRVEVNERIREYVVRLLEATREPSRYQLDDLAPLIEYGASPRAGGDAGAGPCAALAYIRGRGYALPEDVKELAPDVLRHRPGPSPTRPRRAASAQTRSSSGCWPASGFPEHARSPARPAARRGEEAPRQPRPASRRRRPQYPAAAPAATAGLRPPPRDPRPPPRHQRTRRRVPQHLPRPPASSSPRRASTWPATTCAASTERHRAHGRTVGQGVLEERELHLVCAVDVSASQLAGRPAQGRRQAAAEVCTLVTLAAAYSHDRTGLLTFSDRVERYVPPAKGARHAMRLVREVLQPGQPRPRPRSPWPATTSYACCAAAPRSS